MSSGKNLILINVQRSRIRIAQLREGVFSDFHLENRSKPFQVGAVFKAQVVKKQPSLDACFVNVGSNKSAFFHTGRKIYKNPSEESQYAQNRAKNADNSDFWESELQRATFSESFSESSTEHVVRGRNTKGVQTSILKQLRTGQHIMVQVIKDSLKGKNLRVSDKISLPGFYLVYLPNSPFHIAVSRKIEDENMKEKLVQWVERWNKNASLIIRTKAAEVSEEELKRDWDNLQRTWKGIQRRYKARKSPGLIWSDMSFSCKILRDFLTEEVDKVLVDEKQMFLDLKDFTSETMPQYRNKISFYNNKKTSLFDKYDLESAVRRLLHKKIKLRSGGGIVIEETEAAVVVDVNTGSFMGRKMPEENILKINQEAAREIALQLRLRNCGGIIIIDFIDMETESSRQKVMEVLSQELKKDRVPTDLVNMSELAIAQLTRKRVHSSLLETMCEPCFHCDGRGWIEK